MNLGALNLHTFTIHEKANPKEFRLTMDGKEICGVRKFKYESGLDDLPIVTIELLAEGITGDFQAKDGGK